MANSNSTMFQSPLEGNDKDHVLPWSEKELQDLLTEKSADELKDIAEGKVMQHTTVKEESLRQNWLKSYKPQVYEKMIKYPQKIANGESIAIIQFQYDYLCNFDCEHCCIDKFYCLHGQKQPKKATCHIRLFDQISRRCNAYV